MGLAWQSSVTTVRAELEAQGSIHATFTTRELGFRSQWVLPQYPLIVSNSLNMSVITHSFSKPDILYFPIPHNALCLPPKFCINYCCECSWEVCIFPRVFHNNSLCKTWGANRVHHGELENRECRRRSRIVVEHLQRISMRQWLLRLTVNILAFLR